MRDVADTTRIDDLRRRLQKDPASIAFAQLAEEYRRAGKYQDAVDTCRSGLRRHSGYVSARVTLGRALLELGDLDGAHAELTDVLRTAPQNLAAIRGLAEIHRRRGELREALDQYRTAFELAQNDPAIDTIVRELRRQLAPESLRLPVSPPPPPAGASTAAARRRTEAHVAALERWLAAILDDRRARLYGTTS